MEGPTAPPHGPNTPVVLVPPLLRRDGYEQLVRSLGVDRPVRLYRLRLDEWSPPPVAYSLGWEVVGLKELLYREKFPRAHLIASGWTAGIAIAFSMWYPTRVASLTLEDPAFLGHVPGCAGEEEMLFGVRRALARSGPEMLEEFGQAFIAPAELLEWRTFAHLPHSEETYARIRAFCRALIEYPSNWERLVRLQAPVLFIVGRESSPVVSERVRALRALFAHSRVEASPSGHRFRPAHAAEPSEFLRWVRHLWAEAETSTPDGSAGQ